MKIISIRAYEGRNIYAHKPCIKMDVDLEGYSETPSSEINGFNNKLLQLLPELYKHRCGIDEENGFVKRLREGTYLAHICEHIIIAVQNMIGIEVSYGKAREVEGDLYSIIYQYIYKETALKVGNLAVDIINSIIEEKEFDLHNRLNEIKKILKEEYVGTSTSAMCEEAKKLGIPVLKVGETGLYQFGLGKYGKFVEATICEDTSATAVDISCDKLLTKKILEIQCLPVAKGGLVKNKLELLMYADKIGYPIVIKPLDGNHGNGVYVDVQNEKEALLIFEKLIGSYNKIIIEKYIVGKDYRVCVVDGEVVAVSLRVSPFVVGNGESTIKQLIDKINEDNRRGEDHEKPLTKIIIDENLISEISRKGHTLNSIPKKEEVVILRGNANLSTGAIAIDCTDEICTENIDICKRAAKAIGLNICGIDLCCSDISKPISDEGAIIEINSSPGIRMHHFPAVGLNRNVAKDIVSMMFKNTPKNIPIVAITGTNGKTTTTRLIAHVLGLQGYNVGMTTTGGIYINNKCIEKGDTTGPESTETVLLNREIDAAVLECARGGIIRGGLGYDLADVGVITNITEDHLGLDGIETLEDLAYVKSLVVEAVKEDGYAVINGDDEISLTILDRIKCNLIIFSKHKDNKILQCSIEKGGFGIYLEEEYICIQKGNWCEKIISINDIGIALNGRLEYNVENSMAACAALIGLGIDVSVISKGLKSFYCDEEFNPGRFNMYNLNGVTVILDYGHNIDGYKAVLKGALKLRHNRMIGIIGVPGDRLNKNIIEVGTICAEHFDYIYIKEDKDRRGRRKGEVAEFLKKGVLSSGFNKKEMEIILDEEEALNKALDKSVYGDLIIIFFEDYEPLLKIVKERMDETSNKNISLA